MYKSSLKIIIFSAFVGIYIVFTSFSQLNLSEQTRKHEGFNNELHKLKIWINAFIPNDLPGISFNINVGTHTGEFAIPGPFSTSGGFLTDQRGFNNDADASHRMQSFLEIDLGSLQLINNAGSCGKTIQVNPDDGSEDCSTTADASDILVNNYSIGTNASDKPIINFTLEGGASNPCYISAPKIIWKIPVTIIVDTLANKVSISFDGYTSAFPSFEMYSQIDNDDIVTIFQRSPESGADPWWILLSHDREIFVAKDLN